MIEKKKNWDQIRGKTNNEHSKKKKSHDFLPDLQKFIKIINVLILREWETKTIKHVQNFKI